MAFNVITGEYDADGPDLSGTYTDQVGYVQPDVSQGAPSMAPATPTANGYGYYVDPTAQASTSDLLKQALNVALAYDQRSMQNGGMAPRIQMTAVQSQAAQARQKNTMFLLLVGIGIFFLVEHE